MASQEDLNTIDRLIEEAEASYEKWRHPDPYIGNFIWVPLKFTSCYPLLITFYLTSQDILRI